MGDILNEICTEVTGVSFDERIKRMALLEAAVLSAAEEWRAYEKKGTRWHTVRLQKLAALRSAVDELLRAREGGD